jgi:hypothetical protein
MGTLPGRSLTLNGAKLTTRQLKCHIVLLKFQHINHMIESSHMFFCVKKEKESSCNFHS